MPPTYNAIRARNFTYVRYVDGEREYYDRSRTRTSCTTSGRRLSAARMAALDQIMNALIALPQRRRSAGRPGCRSTG